MKQTSQRPRTHPALHPRPRRRVALHKCAWTALGLPVPVRPLEVGGARAIKGPTHARVRAAAALQLAPTDVLRSQPEPDGHASRAVIDTDHDVGAVPRDRGAVHPFLAVGRPDQTTRARTGMRSGADPMWRALVGNASFEGAHSPDSCRAVPWAGWDISASPSGLEVRSQPGSKSCPRVELVFGATGASEDVVRGEHLGRRSRPGAVRRSRPAPGHRSLPSRTRRRSSRCAPGPVSGAGHPGRWRAGRAGQPGRSPARRRPRPAPPLVEDQPHQQLPRLGQLLVGRARAIWCLRHSGHPRGCTWF